jgi:hypothetical protein
MAAPIPHDSCPWNTGCFSINMIVLMITNVKRKGPFSDDFQGIIGLFSKKSAFTSLPSSCRFIRQNACVGPLTALKDRHGLPYKAHNTLHINWL